MPGFSISERIFAVSTNAPVPVVGTRRKLAPDRIALHGRQMKLAENIRMPFGLLRANVFRHFLDFLGFRWASRRFTREV
jgi:hypothetical protein